MFIFHRRTVTTFLTEELHFERNLIEPCWFSLFGTNGQCRAQILVEVGDFIVAALPEDYEMIEEAL